MTVTQQSTLFETCFLFTSHLHSVMSDSLQPQGLQHIRRPCPSPSPGVCSISCPLSWWCHPTISSSVTPFSSWPQLLPASGSFPMTWLFASGGQIIGASASVSVLPMNITPTIYSLSNIDFSKSKSECVTSIGYAQKANKNSLSGKFDFELSHKELLKK